MVYEAEVVGAAGGSVGFTEQRDLERTLKAAFPMGQEEEFPLPEMGNSGDVCYRKKFSTYT